MGGLLATANDRDDAIDAAKKTRRRTVEEKYGYLGLVLYRAVLGGFKDHTTLSTMHVYTPQPPPFQALAEGAPRRTS